MPLLSPALLLVPPLSPAWALRSSICRRCRQLAKRSALVGPRGGARYSSSDPQQPPPPPQPEYKPFTKPTPIKPLILESPYLSGPAFALPNIHPPKVGRAEIDDLSQSLLIFEETSRKTPTGEAIDALKPKYETVSPARYKQVVRELLKSFKLDQLRDFHKKAEAAGQVSPLRKLSTKADFAKSILTDYWNVTQVKEITDDVLVEQTIKSNEEAISILLRDDAHQLRHWANIRSAKITVDIPSSKITITATAPSLRAILMWIRHHTEGIIRENFDLSVLSKFGEFNDEFLAPISATTKTVAKRIDKDTLRISAPPPVTVSLAPHMIDYAHRLLLTSLDPSPPRKDTLLYAPPFEASTKGGLYPVSDTTALPWMYRNRDWARFRSVFTRHPIEPPPVPEPEPPHILSDPIVSALLEPTGALSSSRRMNASYSVTLCYLLHQMQSNTRGRSKTLDTFITSPKSDSYILTPNFPGIPFLDEHFLDKTLLDSANDTFVLYFFPSPWANPTTFQDIPPVSLTIPAPRRRNPRETDLPLPLPRPELKQLNAETSVSILLPSYPCDVRFLRTDATPIALDLDEWSRYYAASNLIPNRKGTRIRAARVLNIGKVEYVFTGMEYRSAAAIRRDGCVWTRTAVEGGSAGGRRTEVVVKVDETDVQVAVQRMVSEAREMVRMLQIFLDRPAWKRSRDSESDP